MSGESRSDGPRRLVLFDVDGTLIRGGPAREAFRAAMTAVFGTAGRIEGHEFSGKTDPQIARELLRDAGLADEDIDAGFPALWARYLMELERRLPARPVRVLPGVERLLDALEDHGELALGLVTGNIAGGAHLKLGSVGLARRFPVGGFGSDAEDREEIPPVALRRARERWGRSFEASSVVIVGDTPRDVACARACEHRAVAVATGRIEREVLDGSGADHVFDDLTGTDRVMSVILGE